MLGLYSSAKGLSLPIELGLDLHRPQEDRVLARANELADHVDPLGAVTCGSRPRLRENYIPRRIRPRRFRVSPAVRAPTAVAG
jgi:hypothetical protein